MPYVLEERSVVRIVFAFVVRPGVGHREIDQLQRENAQLKDQLIGVRTQAINTPRPSPSSTPAPSVDAGEPMASQAIDPGESPIAAAPEPPAAPVVVTPAPAPTPSVSGIRPAPTAPTPPAPTAPVAPAAPTGPGRRYVVQKGDTLFAIAKRHYGTANNARVQAILNANRAVLPSAAALHPGMTLVIPQ